MKKLKPRYTYQDTIPKVCRWCHHYKNGKCYYNTTPLNNFSSIVNDISEEGHLYEVLKESFISPDFIELELKLQEWELSKKKIKELKSIFFSAYESWKLRVLDNLDNDVSILYEKCFKDGVDISDPEEFSCSNWI